MHPPIRSTAVTLGLALALTAVPAHAQWGLRGNNIDPSLDFLGTTDSGDDLNIEVNHARALLIDETGATPNLIGGYFSNGVAATVVGATIGGGGANMSTNSVYDNYGVVAGGAGNYAGDGSGTVSDRQYATVSGGHSNEAQGSESTVSGGYSNLAYTQYATVGGGYYNVVSSYGGTIAGGRSNEVTDDSSITVGGGYSNYADGGGSTIAGGWDNTASAASANYMTIAGGYANSASASSTAIGGGGSNDVSAVYATISGGYNNTASGSSAAVAGGYANTASGSYAAVPGGYYNTASGSYAAVLGGYYNTASGSYSVAAGRSANADDQGCFIWADSTASSVSCVGTDTFNVRANGGLSLGRLTLSSVGASHFIEVYNGAYLTNGGAWTDASRRELKTDIQVASGAAVLQTLRDLPLNEWSYVADQPGVRHLGPMAEDFYALFSLGEPGGIAALDAAGVALASIQELDRLLRERFAALERLESRLASLERAPRPGRTQSAGVSELLCVFLLGATVAASVARRRKR